MSWKPNDLFNNAYNEAIEIFTDELLSSDKELTYEQVIKLTKALKNSDSEKVDQIKQLIKDIFKETLPETYEQFFTYNEVIPKQ